jgi:hypothetical protein
VALAAGSLAVAVAVGVPRAVGCVALGAVPVAAATWLAALGLGVRPLSSEISNVPQPVAMIAATIQPSPSVRLSLSILAVLSPGAYGAGQSSQK